tara:strand:+ start:407 stop:574 length:168 start_codon:yes stop_codon:yes gene_type:complete
LPIKRAFNDLWGYQGIKEASLKPIFRSKISLGREGIEKIMLSLIEGKNYFSGIKP